MLAAWMVRIASLLESVENAKFAMRLVGLAGDDDLNGHISLIPAFSISKRGFSRQESPRKQAYRLSRASQTVEKDPKPSLCRISYQPLWRMSLRRMG